MSDPVADLEIILTAYTAAYVSSMERAAVAGRAAAGAAESAAAASTRAGAAAARSSDGWDLAGKAAHRTRQALEFTGLAVLAAGAFSVKAAANFQQSMELIHTQAGASQTEVERLKTSVLDMAGKVGVGPNELAQGLYHIESAGFRGQAALDMLNKSAIGSRIGMAGMEETTQAMIGVMAAGLPDVHGAADAMAYLNDIVGVGDMRMGKLAQSIATGVLPSFKSAGLGLQDYGAALATITDNVTPADEAATRLRMTVALMGAPSGRATKALASIGMTATQMATDLHQPKGLLVAVMDLKSHLGELHTTAQKVAANQALEHAFGGGRTSGAIMTLIDESDRLASKYDALGTQASRAAAFQDAWAKTQATFKQKVADTRAAVETLAVKIGNQFLPVLGRLADKVTSVAQSVSAHFGDIAAASSALFAGDWSGFAAKIGLTGPAAKTVAGALKDTVQIAQNLWRLVQGFLPDLGLLAAAFGVAVAGALQVLNPLLGFLADHGGPIADVLLAMAAGMLAYKLVTIAIAGPQRVMAAGQWLINAAMDANPIGLMVAAVAALAVGVMLAWKHSETFRDVVVGVFDLVKIAVLGFAASSVDVFRTILMVWMETAGGILHGAAMAFGWLPGWGKKLKHADSMFRDMKDNVLGSMDDLSKGLHSQLDKAARDTAIQSALTGIALTKGLADRMPAYEALAYKYGMTLPQVLDRARLPAKDKAFLLAMAPVSAVLGTMGPMSKAVAAWADMPRGGMAAAVAAAQKAAGDLAQTPHAALLAAESGLRQDAFNVGDNITAGLVAGMQAHQAAVGAQAQAMGASAVRWAAYGGGVMSPSKLTRYVGEMIGEGLIVGMANRHGAVAAAAGALGAMAVGDTTPMQAGGGRSMPGGGAIPAVGTMRGGAIPGGGGSGGTTVIHNHNHFHVDGKEIHSSVQTQELRYQDRNGRSAFSR